MPHKNTFSDRRDAQFTSTSAFFVATAISASMMPPSAHAAAALEEVIVTARKTEESSQSVPISLTAFTAEDLQKRGATEFRDLTTGNPSVKINAGGAGTAISSTVAIRGNIQNDVSVVADPAVGTYIDGLIAARTFGMNGQLVDLESVQTLKGPQGTLFGRNTTGGTLVIQTRNPERDLGGYVRAEAGNYNLRHYTGVLNVPISESIALRLVADENRRDGYVTTDDGREWGDAVSRTYRAKLLWEPDDLTSVLLAAESVDMHGTSTLNTSTQPNRPDYDNVPSIVSTVYGPVPLQLTNEKNAAEVTTYSLTVSRETNLGEFKLIAGQRKVDVAIVTSLPPISGYSYQDKPDNVQNSVELQFNGSMLNDRLQLTSGLYYFDEETHERQNTFNFLRTQVSFANLDTDSKSASIYAQGNYELTDTTRLLIGGRFTSDDRETDGSYILHPHLTYSDSESRFNYLVSLDHEIAPDKLVYISTASGYRSGFAAIAPAADGRHWTALEPESITNYEIGVKTQWFDQTLRINMAVYKQDYKDYQAAFIRQIGTTLIRGYENFDATITGTELEVSWAATDTLRLGGTYAYTDATTEEKGGSDSLRLSNIPKSSYSLFVSKSFSVAAGELEVRADYDWQDEWFSQIYSRDLSIIDDLGLLNLNVTYTRDNWTVSAYVKNATDEGYYTYINEFDLGGFVALDGGALGLPRTSGVSVTYNF
jgi:iron complex outermembrane receptor protein